MEGEQLPGLLRTPMSCSCGGWRAQCARAPGLPRFCHELNRPHLIEPGIENVRTRGIMRFRPGSVAVGAISNPSVSAEKSQISGCLFRICHEIRHFCHVCEAFRSGRSELDHEFPLINLLGCGWTGRRFSAAARETASAYPSVSRGGAMRRPPFLHSGGFGRVLPTASDAVIVAAPASGCWPHGNPLLRLCLRCRPCSAGGR